MHVPVNVFECAWLCLYNERLLIHTRVNSDTQIIHMNAAHNNRANIHACMYEYRGYILVMMMAMTMNDGRKRQQYT